jgi:hypothetical protein
VGFQAEIKFAAGVPSYLANLVKNVASVSICFFDQGDGFATLGCNRKSGRHWE